MLLVAIFVYMLLLNYITPLLSDDYFISFVWPKGMRINATLPADAKRVSSFSDVFESLKNYYCIWGGRIPGQTFMTLFAWWGKLFFNGINAFMAVLLIAEIYWISHKGKISLYFEPSNIFWIFFSLWSFNTVFVDIFLWLSGSCEYLWMMVILLAFLLPYVQNYYDPEIHKNDSKLFCIGMFVAGMLAGCSRETLICWIIVVLGYWLTICRKEDRLQAWKIGGFIGLCIGYGTLIFSPGNLMRLITDAQTNLIVPSEFLKYKIQLACILLSFQFFLWHFVVFSFMKAYRKLECIKKKNNLVKKHINLSITSFVIASGNVLVLLSIHYYGARPFFLTLVFLLITALLICGLNEEFKLDIVKKSIKGVCRFVGFTYLLLSMFVSLYYNYINWNHWNTIVGYIEQEKMRPIRTVLEIPSYPIDPVNQKRLFFVSNFSIMSEAGTWMLFPLINMPLFPYEQNSENIMRYYGISGINIMISKKEN